jgi:Bacterial transcriptional activator domain
MRPPADGVAGFELGILGPVRAVRAGRDVAQGGPKQRAVLALLVLALYRAERQADAQAAYHRARAVLTEELGSSRVRICAGSRRRCCVTRFPRRSPRR